LKIRISKKIEDSAMDLLELNRVPCTYVFRCYRSCISKVGAVRNRPYVISLYKRQERPNVGFGKMKKIWL
jgi:hypothetical protein